MYTILVVALLLALFFDTTAATSPAIDPTLPVAPIMGSFYPDPDGMLGTVCELCGTSILYCTHSFITDPLQRGPPIFTLDDYNDPQWSSQEHDMFPFPDGSELEQFPQDQFNSSDMAQPLDDTLLRQLDEDATTVQPSTIRSHLRDIYLPGDRIEERSRGSRRTSNKRQAPRQNGFPCSICGKLFNRACDVKRHQKTHLDRSERPHRCDFCSEAFLYPKDLNRHQNKHTQAQGALLCPVPGCRSEGFSRRDNLLRHQRKQHSSSVTSS